MTNPGLHAHLPVIFWKFPEVLHDRQTNEDPGLQLVHPSIVSLHALQLPPFLTYPYEQIEQDEGLEQVEQPGRLVEHALHVLALLSQ